MIKDEEFNELKESICEIVLKCFSLIGAGKIQEIKPIVSDNYYALQLSKYEHLKELGLKQVYKDISFLALNFEDLERDEKGIKLLLFQPIMCIEMYVIDENTNEIVNGTIDYQQEVKYDIILSRNDDSLNNNTQWIIEAVAEKGRKKVK